MNDITVVVADLFLLDTATGMFTSVASPPFDRTDMRMNDAKADRAGRFWFGTMQDDGNEPTGALYRYESGITSVEVDSKYTIPNGFAWSPDNRRMYIADTRDSTIYVYDFDLDSGTATNRRPFAVSAHVTCNGATVDAKGFLWSACPGGFALVRYSPDGAVDRVVELPVERPTSVIFGGDDLRTLYVTTATRSSLKSH